MDEAMERSIFDQEMAIQEITRGYKLATRLHSILPTGEPQRELIGILFGEVLQALSTALSILKSSNKSKESSNVQMITETGSASVSDQGSTESSEEVKSSTPTSGCGKRERQERLRTMNPWTKVTYSPHDDGHQWRKYGQKNIQKSKLSRSYYRCTYKGEGCQATKHIQQKDCGDPPLFLVTYYEQHTCESNAPPMIISPQITQYPLHQVEPNLFSFESNANVVSNQERAMLYSSLKTSTAQKDTELGKDDLQNISIPQKSMKSVANSEEFLDAMPNTRIDEDISASVCMSPSWEVMSMDYWTMTGSFGYDAIDSFSSF